MGAVGYPVCQDGTIGNGWKYSNGTLTLTDGTFDFSSTHPQGKTPGTPTTTPVACTIVIESGVTITGGIFNGAVENRGTINNGTFEHSVENNSTISDGTFEGIVTNNSTISGGTFQNRCSVTNSSNGTISGGTFSSTSEVYNYNRGTIEKGTFEGSVINNAGGTISGGTFAGSVTNKGTISGGAFQNTCSVTNNGTINDNGIFEGKVTNDTFGTILGGTFSSTVENHNNISGGTFQETSGVINEGTIKDNGTFEGTVINTGTNAIIENGTFNGEVQNSIEGTISGGAFSSTSKVYNYSGTISGGTFEGSVTNYRTISGGTFAGSVNNRDSGTVTGGVFNGKKTTKPATDAYSITLDAAYPNAKIEKVNDVSAEWDPYVVIEGNALPEVTVTASTKIYSLNHKPLGTKPYNSSQDSSDQNTVKFKMPKEGVIIGCGGLIMVGGFPVDSNTGTVDCEGKGWQYSKIDTSNPKGKLTLTSGTFDFNSTYPQNPNKGAGAEFVECAVKIESSVAEITGGTFNGTVTNHAGTISGGKFEGTVINSVSGTISGNGTFNATVTNDINGEISNGTFNATVTNFSAGKISGGTFNGTVTNKGNIMNGTFKGRVTNNQGNIYGGTFAAGLSKNSGHIYYGVFNGKTALTAKAHHVTVTNGSVSQVNGEDPRKVDETTGAVTTDTAWDLYAYEGTTVTIIASTEIFSLNGKPIAESSYGVDKKTVTFTMPDDDVVLNGAITCTDLVMENGWPQASKDGQISCSGTDWSYDKNTKTLTLTSGTFDFSTTQPVQCEIEIQSSRAEITGGTFAGSVTNKGTIKNGSFEQEVTNNAGGEISGGTFYGTVTNSGYIKDGTFNGKVTNRNTIENGTFAGSVTNEGTIKNGSFEKKVTNSNTIMDGVFKGAVENGGNGKIFGGTFAGSVNNSYGGNILGGVFNGHINVPGFGVYPITVDTASSKAEIKEVNGVSAVWEPYVVVTELTKNQKVIITASTKIYSLNHKPLSTDNCNSAHDGNENTVKFTMPNANVVLNGAITSTDLVMENGWPKDSSSGKNPCKGDGWQYIPNDPTYGDMLLLTGSNQTGGLFDFSTIGDGSAVECNVFVGKPTAITGGEFNGKVFNNSGILGGTFHGEVDNMGPGRIENGTFKNSVENNGMIENGAFHDEVKNNGTIEKGTFEGTVENNTNGTISGGTFAGSVSNNGGTVNGGIFNGNTGLDGVTDLHSITWDAASSNAKIEKVNGVSADWAPYVVTSNATTKEVTITADTEIFSLNGQPIAESSYGVDKKTVTFTMPDDDVVLNSELITKPEPEPEPEPEPKPEPEPTTYTVTVIGGTIDGKTSVSAKEKDTLTVVLDQNDIPDGMTFDMWSISSSKLSGDINVDYRAEAMTFQMPAEDVTIRAQYRSAEIIEDAAPSPLATAATIAVGGAAAGIVVWQGVNLGVDLYLANALPQGVPVPTDRRALALLLWETAGKPEVALPTLYGDIPAEEIELQKATRWAVQNGLMDAADKKDASFFDPDHYVTKMDVFGAWLRLKKLLGTT